MLTYLQSFQGIVKTGQHHAWTPYAFFAVTLGINIWVLSKGISGGIEKLAKIGMPILFLFAIILAIVVFTLPPGPSGETALQGYEFIYKPNFSRIGEPGIWLAAAGQIFFTLSVGMGSCRRTRRTSRPEG